MKKEEKSYMTLAKPRRIFKYELKGTNEIMKETTEFFQSSHLSTAHTHRNTPPSVKDFDPIPYEQSGYNRPPQVSTRPQIMSKPKETSSSKNKHVSNSQTKPTFAEPQNKKRSFASAF